MMKKIGIVFACLASLLVLFVLYAILVAPSAAPIPDQERHYVISGVRVLDVEAGSFGPPVSVTIENGLIAAVGSRTEARGGQIIDGGGGFLVPAFWDMHMHSFQLSPQLHFPLFVANGVTNVRDMMDCPEMQDSLIACVGDKRGWSAEVESGTLAAPRFVEVSSFYFERDSMTPPEAQARAQIYSERGIDSLKVYNRLSPEAYKVLGQSAAEFGMRLVGHLPKQVSLTNAVAAGQISFEHGHLFLQQCFGRAADWRAGKLDDLSPLIVAERMLSDHDSKSCRAHMAAMSEAGAWFVPTHGTREEDARAADESFAKDPRLDYLDPLSRWAFGDDQAATVARYPGIRGERALQSYFAKGLDLTGKAHQANVGILVGTDSIIGGFRYHDEMAHLVRAGLSPADVLRAATIDAARYAKLDSRSGSIEIGKRADLVLLTSNPLENIEHTRTLKAVWLAGRLYNREGLDALLAFTKEQAGNPANWVRLLWGFARSNVSGEL